MRLSAVTNKLILCFLSIIFIFTSCGQESDTELTVSWTSLSKKHSISGLISFDYDKTDKVFVLGYADGFSGRYEIRDENFNILKEKKLGITPYSIVYTKDSIYTARDFLYFKTDNGKIVVAEDGGIINLYDPVTKSSKTLYTDPTAAFYISFNSFAETGQYYVLSINSETTCVFIDKTTHEVITFGDSFKDFNADGGWSVVKTKQGDVVLSILLGGKVVYGYLIYKNGTWQPFQPTTLPELGKIKFVDSRGYAWLDNGYDNTHFKLYDVGNNRFITTTPSLLSGNYFGYSLRELPNGDIILMSGTLVSVTYELMQISLTKQ